MVKIEPANFSVNVHYSYDNFMEVGLIDDEIINVVGKNRISSVADNGIRTLKFSFMTEEEANMLCSKVMVLAINLLSVDVFQDE